MDGIKVKKDATHAPAGISLFPLPPHRRGFFYWIKSQSLYKKMHGSTKERSEIYCKREIPDKNRLLKLRQEVKNDQTVDNVYNDGTFIGD